MKAFDIGTLRQSQSGSVWRLWWGNTVYPKKYAHGFVVLCFVVVMQSFIMNSHEVFIHIHQGRFAGTGAIVRLPQCQWSKPDGYGKISQCITTTKHSKAKTVCIFLGIYCIFDALQSTRTHIASALGRWCNKIKGEFCSVMYTMRKRRPFRYSIKLPDLNVLYIIISRAPTWVLLGDKILRTAFQTQMARVDVVDNRWNAWH